MLTATLDERSPIMRIQVTPEQLEGVAKDFQNAYLQSFNLISGLNTKIRDLEARWSGMKSEKFYRNYQQAYQQYNQYLTTLQNIEKELKDIAVRFRQTDQGGIASEAVLKPNLDYSTYNETIKYMRDEMVKNATGDRVDYMRKAPILAQYSAWFALVRPNGSWDHKPILDDKLQLKEKKDYYFPIPGDSDHEYFYDIYSNVHYAFVGRFSGFTEKELKIGSHGFGFEFIAGRTDKSDDVSLQIGFELYNEYKNNPEALTEEAITKKILEHKDVYIEDKKAIPIKNGK